jgi:tripartite motif-containing protein 71
MDIRLGFLLLAFLLANSGILVFLTGTQQHGLASVEEEYGFHEEETKNDNNNPLGFKSIKKFDSDGNFITSWGSEGTGDNQFWLPHDIAIDSSDNVYVVDSGNVHEKKNICAI